MSEKITKEQLDELERVWRDAPSNLPVKDLVNYLVDNKPLTTKMIAFETFYKKHHTTFPALLEMARENSELRRHIDSLKGHIRLLESPEMRNATISKTY